ncbi:MAG: hypothetical protein NC927_00130 [Candidatus Omnitrophica bacterium]|nr:hypothetical protein [Candidatus Omnitrophota bacterium]
MRNKGQLLIVLVVLSVMLITGMMGAVLLYMAQHHRIKLKEFVLTDDFYYAHGGIERAMWKLQVTPNPIEYVGEFYTIPGTNVPIVLSVNSLGLNQYRIYSLVLQTKSGKELSITRVLEAIVEREVLDNGKVRIKLIKWQELSPQQKIP